MAAMVAPRALSRGEREGTKKRCQNGRRCHDPTVALTVNLMIEATMVAPVSSMVASMALDGFDGFDGGFEGFGGGFDGLDGFVAGVAGVAETEGSRAQKR